MRQMLLRLRGILKECVCNVRTYSVVDSSRISTFIVSILLVVYGSFRQVVDILYCRVVLLVMLLFRYQKCVCVCVLLLYEKVSVNYQVNVVDVCSLDSVCWLTYTL